MTIGTGIFVASAWLALAAAYLSKEVSNIGAMQATRNAWVCTIVGVAISLREILPL